MSHEGPTRQQTDQSGLSSEHSQSNLNDSHFSLKDVHHLHATTSNNTNNKSTSLKRGQKVISVSHQSSLPLPDGNGASAKFLVPPNFFPRERRHSTSSCDSSVSQVSKRRLSRNSSCRLSDFEDDNKEITLLGVGRSIGNICKRVNRGLRRLAGILFVPRPQKPQIVCEADVMEQAAWIISDHVISRLTIKHLMSRKVGLTASDWPKSVHVTNASQALEAAYPKIYSNVSRKLCMTMSSPKVVTTTLDALFRVLFEETITWGKIVSMLTVASLFAEECASQGHADYVKDVVEVVVDFTEAHLLPWLMSQGGWESFPAPDVRDRSRLSKLRLLILTAATTAFVMATSAICSLWGPY